MAAKLRNSNTLATIFLLLLALWVNQTRTRRLKTKIPTAPQGIANIKTKPNRLQASLGALASNAVVELEQNSRSFSLTFLNSPEARVAKQTLEFPLNPKAQKINFSELLYFLNQQSGHKKKYVIDEHDCKHFAHELYVAALAKNIEVFFVAIDLADTDIGHAVAAFDTKDQGLVYVDFTPTRVNGKFVQKRRLAWLEEGTPYFDLDLDRLPMGFENKFYFFKKHYERQADLQSNSKDFQKDISEINEAIYAYQRHLKDYNARVQQINESAQALTQAELNILNTEKAQLDTEKVEIEDWQQDLRGVEDDLQRKQQELGYPSSDWVIQGLKFFPERSASKL